MIQCTPGRMRQFEIIEQSQPGRDSLLLISSQTRSCRWSEIRTMAIHPPYPARTDLAFLFLGGSKLNSVLPEPRARPPRISKFRHRAQRENFWNLDIDSIKKSIENGCS